MNMDHSFTSEVKQRARSKSISHHELFHNFGSMYKVCRYYDEAEMQKRVDTADISVLIFRHASVSSTYPCKLVGPLVGP